MPLSRTEEFLPFVGEDRKKDNADGRLEGKRFAFKTLIGWYCLGSGWQTIDYYHING